MPQHCPHCGMWLPRADETHCPQCNNDLSKPPIELDEDEEDEKEERARKPSVFDLAVVVGNAIQIIPAVALLLLITGGLVYGLAFAVVRKDVGGVLCFLPAVLACVWVLYFIAKRVAASLRKQRDR